MKQTRKYLKLFLVVALSFNSFCSAGIVEIIAGLSIGAFGAESIWRIFASMPHKLPQKDIQSILKHIHEKKQNVVLTKKLKYRIIQIMAQDPNLTNEAVANQIVAADDFDDLIKSPAAAKRASVGSIVAPAINIAALKEVATLVAQQLRDQAPNSSPQIDYTALVNSIMRNHSAHITKIIASELAKNPNVQPAVIAERVVQLSEFRTIMTQQNSETVVTLNASMAQQLAAFAASQKRENEAAAQKKAAQDRDAEAQRDAALEQRLSAQTTTVLSAHQEKITAAIVALKAELAQAQEAQAQAGASAHETRNAQLDDTISKLKAQIAALSAAQTQHETQTIATTRAEVKQAIDAERELRTEEHAGNVAQMQKLVDETLLRFKTDLSGELLKKIDDELRAFKDAQAKLAASNSTGSSNAASDQKKAAEDAHQKTITELIHQEIAKQLQANPQITREQLTTTVLAMPELDRYVTQHNLKDSLIGQHTELRRLTDEAVRSYQTQLMQLRVDITGLLHEKEAAHSKRVGALNEQYAKLQKEIEALQSARSTSESASQAQQRSIDQLLADKKQLEAKIAAEEKARTEQDAALDKRLAQLQGSFEAQLTTMKAVQGNNYGEFTQFRDLSDTLNREQRTAQQVAKAERTALAQKIDSFAAAQTKAIAAGEGLATVIARAEALEGRVAAVESAQKGYTETIQAHEKALDVLRSELAATKAANAQANAGQLAAMEQQVAAAQAQVQQASTANPNAEQLAALTKQISALQDHVNSELKKLDARVSENTNKISDLLPRTAALEQFQREQVELNKQFARTDVLGGLYVKVAAWEEFSKKYENEYGNLRANVDATSAQFDTIKAVSDRNNKKLKELDEALTGNDNAAGAAQPKSSTRIKLEQVINAILGANPDPRFAKIDAEQQQQNNHIANLKRIAGASDQLTGTLQHIVDLANSTKKGSECAHCVVQKLARTADAQMLLDMRRPIDDREAELKKTAAKGAKGTPASRHATPSTSRRGSTAGLASASATPRLRGTASALHGLSDRKRSGESAGASCGHKHSPASDAGSSHSGSGSCAGSPAPSVPASPAVAATAALTGGGGAFTFQPVHNDTAFGSMTALQSQQAHALIPAPASAAMAAGASSPFGSLPSLDSAAPLALQNASASAHADSGFGTLSAADSAHLTQHMALTVAASDASSAPAKPVLTVAITPAHSPNASIALTAESPALQAINNGDAPKPKNSPTAAQLLAHTQAHGAAAVSSPTALSLTAPGTPPDGLRAHAKLARHPFVNPHSSGAKSPRLSHTTAPAIGRGVSAPRGRGRGTVPATPPTKAQRGRGATPASRG